MVYCMAYQAVYASKNNKPVCDNHKNEKEDYNMNDCIMCYDETGIRCAPIKPAHVIHDEPTKLWLWENPDTMFLSIRTVIIFTACNFQAHFQF